VEDNSLAKRTASTRQLTVQRLAELYGLDASVPLFRILRSLWDRDGAGQPLLALLLAMARDPLLRVTAPPVLAMQPGEELARQQLTDALRENVRDRLNDDSLDKVVRNTAASWTQSGHLVGRSRKSRQVVNASPVVTCYALLLGYFLGVRGVPLFETVWAKALDASADQLVSLAMDAKRLGLMDIKQSGGLFSFAFNSLTTADERRLAHGTN